MGQRSRSQATYRRTYLDGFYSYHHHHRRRHMLLYNAPITVRTQCITVVQRKQLAEYLADVGVVKVWVGLEYLSSFLARPHHERVHRSLDVVACRRRSLTAAGCRRCRRCCRRQRAARGLATDHDALTRRSLATDRDIPTA